MGGQSSRGRPDQFSHAQRWAGCTIATTGRPLERPWLHFEEGQLPSPLGPGLESRRGQQGGFAGVLSGKEEGLQAGGQGAALGRVEIAQPAFRFGASSGQGLFEQEA